MIKVGEWFNLPRLGRDKFISLMKAGLIYDKTKGFKAEANSDLATITSILKTVLNKDFEFIPKCFICNSNVECYICAYYNICDTKIIKPNCICAKCISHENLLSIYAKTFVKKLSQLNNNY